MEPHIKRHQRILRQTMVAAPKALEAELPPGRPLFRLHPVRGRPVRCGPTALAALSGEKTDYTAFVIRTVRDDGRNVYGVAPVHMVQAGIMLGLRLNTDVDSLPIANDFKRLTLRQWEKQRATCGTYLLWVGSGRTSHYITCLVDRAPDCGPKTFVYADTGDYRAPLPLEHRRSHLFGPRSRVNIVWSVTTEPDD